MSEDQRMNQRQEKNVKKESVSGKTQAEEYADAKAAETKTTEEKAAKAKVTEEKAAKAEDEKATEKKTAKEKAQEVTTSLPCEVVRDLLPLYHDEVVSYVTASEVEKHLDRCASCRQEYLLFGEKLPQTGKEQAGSKQKFDDFRKKLKKKKNREKFIACLAAVVCLIGLLLLQDQFAVIPISLKYLSVDRVYVVDREDGDKDLFLLYRQGKYNCPTMMTTSYKQTKDGAVTNIKFGRTLLYRIGNERAGLFSWTIRGNTEKVTVNGTTIWSVEENGNTPVPEYVYEYFKGEDAQTDSDAIDGIRVDISKNRFELSYADGTDTTWDLDGNVIERRKPGEDEDMETGQTKEE